MLEIFEENGIIMALGAVPKPRDPAEDKYMAARTMPPLAVNMNEPISLLQFCPEILNQGILGACAQFSVAEADFITRNGARAKAGQSVNAELAHAGFLYEVTRRRRGWFPRDSGSMPSDGFDVLLTDKPLNSRYQYVQEPGFDYEDRLFTNPAPIDDLASHRPFYVSEGNAVERIKQCLDMRMAVVLCMDWHPSYNSPRDGIMQIVNAGPEYGGHAMTIRGYTPDRGGLFAVINHWSAGWNQAVKNLGFDFRPGEAAMPASFFQATPSPVWELRAASPEAIQSEPEPEEPVDQGHHQFTATVLKATTGKLWLDPAVKLPNLKGRLVRGVGFQGKVKRNDEDVMVLKGTFDVALKDKIVQCETV